MAGTRKVQQQQRSAASAKNGNGRVVPEMKRGSVRATVWENQASNGVYHRITFSKLYKKGGNARPRKASPCSTCAK